MIIQPKSLSAQYAIFSKCYHSFPEPEETFLPISRWNHIWVSLRSSFILYIEITSLPPSVNVNAQECPIIVSTIYTPFKRFPQHQNSISLAVWNGAVYQRQPHVGSSVDSDDSESDIVEFSESPPVNGIPTRSFCSTLQRFSAWRHQHSNAPLASMQFTKPPFYNVPAADSSTSVILTGSLPAVVF